MAVNEIPKPWADLIEALTIMARHPANDVSPTHCAHDELQVMANPAEFTAEEIERLAELRFYPSEFEGVFYSNRYGSA